MPTENVTMPQIRFGEADLSSCDRELIHIPGSIQPHGLLMVLNRRNLVVEQIAGEPRALFGLEVEQVLNARLGILFDSRAEDFVAAQVATPASFIAPAVCLAVQSRSGSLQLDVTIHALEDTAIIEVEPAQRTLTGAGEAVVRLKSLMAAVQPTTRIEACCEAAAAAMRTATGFDRAMVYRFLPDGSGVVAAESARFGLESFLGLHYPASDIPKQARELYLRNWLRSIPDINYTPAVLKPAVNPRTGKDLDMTHCDLRSVSPVHLEYLRNMGVCASLSASIICKEKLWGMLVLHHYTPRRLSTDLRVACETFAQVLSLHIDAKINAEAAAARDAKRQMREALVPLLPNGAEMAPVLGAWSLLEYVGATGAVIRLQGCMLRIGITPSSEQIAGLVNWLEQLNHSFVATESLCTEHPPAASFAACCSGLLAVAMSHEPHDYILWFRPEMTRAVRWAGDPSKPNRSDRLGARLTPRGSFAEWIEVSRGKAESWSPVEIEAAQELRNLLMEALLRNVESARQKQMLEETRAMAEELERRVQRRTEQLRAMAADVEAAEYRERQQIAQDLHDDLGQTLAAARIRLATLCDDEREDVQVRAQAVADLLDQANESIYSLAGQLAPTVLRELGFAAAVDWLAEEMERSFGLLVKIVDDGAPKPLAQDTASLLYRAVRELLINVARHANSDRAMIMLERRDVQIVVQVSDSGVGYDSSTVWAGARQGFGLISLRERLLRIGGSAHFSATPGAGTNAILTAPLVNADASREDPLP